MFFSIITPIFNVSRFISRGLDCILSQDFRDFELILVDDGSSDASPQMCDRAAADDPRVRVIHQENAGVGAARNTGLDAARGEYILFCDIDDLMLPGALSILHALLYRQHPDLLVFSYEEYDTMTGRTTPLRFHPARYQSNKELRDDWLDNLSGLRFNNGFVWNKAYRRDFIKEHKLHFEPLRIQQDEVFNLSVYPHIETTIVTDSILYRYYVYHSGNIRNNYIPERLDIYRRVRDAMTEICNIWEIDDPRFERYIHSRFYHGVTIHIDYELRHNIKDLSNRRSFINKIFSSPDISNSLNKVGIKPPKFGCYLADFEIRKAKSIIRKATSLLTSLYSRIQTSLKVRYWIKSGKLIKLADYLYKEQFGEFIDWKNPKDLNQWINYLAFRTDTAKWSLLADKFQMRKYVADKGFGDKLVPLLKVWNHPDDISLDDLPDRFVIKMNNGCGDILIVEDKTKIELHAIRNHFTQLFKHPFGKETAEPHYLRIRPKIIAEQLLSSSENTLKDYKFWCFNGKPEICLICADRNKETLTIDLYEADSNWKRISDNCLCFSSRMRPAVSPTPCPTGIKDMLEIATSLSNGYSQMRVDFYETNGRVYIGEITMTSAGGRINYFNQETLAHLGSLCLKASTNR